jgi:hypothetical protein
MHSLCGCSHVNQLMHSIITVVDIKIYVVSKSKRHIKNYSNMFRITQDPSSGSDNLYLTETTYNGSNVLVMCVVGVWWHIMDLWCVCARACVHCVGRRNAHTHTHTSTGYHSLMMDPV